jgi:hypothetical protein
MAERVKISLTNSLGEVVGVLQDDGGWKDRIEVVAACGAD